MQWSGVGKYIRIKPGLRQQWMLVAPSHVRGGECNVPTDADGLWLPNWGKQTKQQHVKYKRQRRTAPLLSNVDSSHQASLKPQELSSIRRMPWGRIHQTVIPINALIISEDGPHGRILDASIFRAQRIDHALARPSARRLQTYASRALPPTADDRTRTFFRHDSCSMN